ncbi:putative late blight resistance protein homolog R1A-3 [Diospyros lotus]|uniref:putative late blight resistance protein homolog R1A-3 n=1 Tax=Diospyros lotus TaxID=55363 RepID=UPI00225034EE|nr:putative late blight resistance protein homolog R1A-3 [Diospyros lotus]
MASIPLDSTVGFLLQNLEEFIKYNANLIGGAEDGFKSLSQELGFLKSCLQKCMENCSDDSILESLADNVRNLVHEAEDAIETYIVLASKQRGRTWTKKALNVVDHTMEIRNLAKKIKSISSKVEEFYKNKLQFIASQTPPRTPERGIRKPPIDDIVVGLEDETEKLIELLTEGTEQLEVISIVGMLGLGKTTIAKKVFNHPTIEYHFSIRTFVEVSQDYRKNEMFLKILRTFTRITDEMRSMSDDDLAILIRQNLKKRQYLIVLDDVWTTQAWDDLKDDFPNSGVGSRILITTREKPVAEYARKKIDPHFLRFLNPEESRELLRRKVFGENTCPTDLEEHEAPILQRCGGLPLSIVVVAGVLTNNRYEVRWWKKVAEGVENCSRTAELQIDYVINLSFNNLPYRVKPCFLYLGVFREDFEIPVRTLLQLWVSEGFIPPSNGNRSLEDVAEDYLEDMVDRSLVMVLGRRSNGQLKAIRIHDTLRDFCKNHGRKESLFREIRTLEQATNSSGSTSFDNDRRHCVNSYVLDYVKHQPAGKHVRSLLTFAKEELNLPVEYHTSFIPKTCELLRVLEVRKIRLSRFPSQVFNLYLLKYIAITCDLKILPKEISNLWNLQTLIVNTSAPSLDIKADLWKIARLRHLDTNVSTSLLAKTKADSSININIQTISALSPVSCQKEVFERAPMLKKLGICGKLVPIMEGNAASNLFGSLQKLEFLENLKLLNTDTTAKLLVLPNESNFPSNLTKLTLLNTKLDWKYMSTLGKLKKLEVLKLKENAFEGTSWTTENGGFQRLKVLHIGSTDLTVWKASASHFPKLTHLFLRHCIKLEKIPSGLADIPTLKLMDLYCNDKSVALSARELQRAKLQVLAQDKNAKDSVFKLSIYPPEL